LMPLIWRLVGDVWEKSEACGDMWSEHPLSKTQTVALRNCAGIDVAKACERTRSLKTGKEKGTPLGVR